MERQSRCSACLSRICKHPLTEGGTRLQRSSFAVGKLCTQLLRGVHPRLDRQVFQPPLDTGDLSLHVLAYMLLADQPGRHLLAVGMFRVCIIFSFVVAVVRMLAGLSQLPAQGKAGAMLRPTRTDEQLPAPDSPVTPVTRLIFVSGSTDWLTIHPSNGVADWFPLRPSLKGQAAHLTAVTAAVRVLHVYPEHLFPLARFKGGNDLPDRHGNLAQVLVEGIGFLTNLS